MFNSLVSNEALHTAMEVRSEEAEKKYREFLESRIQRRWNFNKGSVNKALEQLDGFEKRFSSIKQKLKNKKWDTNKAKEITLKMDLSPAEHLIKGLTQFPGLVKTFEEIASLPPSKESGNLLHFKTDMVKSLTKNASAYTFASYKVYASKTKSTTTNTTVNKLGYTDKFIDTIEEALVSSKKMITDMKQHESLIKKLGDNIVEAMLGPDGKEYIHARRGFELVCTLFTSILTNAWSQFMNQALAVMNKLTEVYS